MARVLVIVQNRYLIDARVRRETEALAELLLRLRETTGASLAVIEHDIPLVTSIADELVCLHLGRVIALGPPAAVLEDPEVVSSYLGTSELAIARSGSGGTGRAARGQRRRQTRR